MDEEIFENEGAGLVCLRCGKHRDEGGSPDKCACSAEDLKKVRQFELTILSDIGRTTTKEELESLMARADYLARGIADGRVRALPCGDFLDSRWGDSEAGPAKEI